MSKYLNVTSDSYGELAPKKEEASKGQFSLDYQDDGSVIIIDNETGKRAKFSPDEIGSLKGNDVKSAFDNEQSRLDDMRFQAGQKGLKFSQGEDGSVVPHYQDFTPEEKDDFWAEQHGPFPGKPKPQNDYNVDEEDPELVEKYPNIRKMLGQN